MNANISGEDGVIKGGEVCENRRGGDPVSGENLFSPPQYGEVFR